MQVNINFFLKWHWVHPYFPLSPCEDFLFTIFKWNLRMLPSSHSHSQSTNAGRLNSLLAVLVFFFFLWYNFDYGHNLQYLVDDVAMNAVKRRDLFSIIGHFRLQWVMPLPLNFWACSSVVHKNSITVFFRGICPHIVEGRCLSDVFWTMHSIL